MSAWAAHRLKRYQLPECIFEQYDALPDTPIKLPKIKINFNMKLPKNLDIISKVHYVKLFFKYFLLRLDKQVIVYYIITTVLLKCCLNDTFYRM
jgi:hypothetical protein